MYKQTKITSVKSAEYKKGFQNYIYKKYSKHELVFFCLLLYTAVWHILTIIWYMHELLACWRVSTLSEFGTHWLGVCVPCPHTLPLQVFGYVWTTAPVQAGAKTLVLWPLQRPAVPLGKGDCELQIPARCHLSQTPRRVDVTAEQIAP